MRLGGPLSLGRHAVQLEDNDRFGCAAQAAAVAADGADESAAARQLEPEPVQ